MSRPHIRRLLQVLLRFYIFLVLNFYLMLLISLALHMNSNIGLVQYTMKMKFGESERTMN